MGVADLTGQAFEDWLFNPEHRRLPDFLDPDMPTVAFGQVLQKGDIRSLRALAVGPPGGSIPTHLLAGMTRLYAANIIGRLETLRGVVYFLTPYSYEVLIHNVSYKEPRP